MSTFDDGQPEKSLTLLRNFKTAVDGTGMTTPTGRINYLRTMLRGKILGGFDKLSLQGNTTNNHLNHIVEGLLDEFFPLHALSKQKRAMRRAMRKPRSMPFKLFYVQLTSINYFIPLFPGSDASKKMPPEELNEILLHAVSSGWSKQSYIQVW